jgi:hypothetical protein
MFLAKTFLVAGALAAAVLSSPPDAAGSIQAHERARPTTSAVNPIAAPSFVACCDYVPSS